MASDATAAVEQALPRSLKLERVLMDDPDGKSVFALCSTANGESKAIVILGKKPWSEADIRSVVEGADTELNEFHRNDKFSKYHGRPPPPMNEVAVTLICPANEWDIAKYTTQKRFAVRETPALYAAATLPFVDEIPAKQLTWVQAIIDRKAEMDHLVYEDDGVMMVKDTKWDFKDKETLHTLAIFKDRSVRSVRDLRGDHLPMLKELRAGGLAELRTRYGLAPSSLRVYMHYLPTFWWAHVHFANLKCPAMGATTTVGKAILLDDIIDSLERDPDFYATASLSFVVGDGEPLYKRLCAAGGIDSGAVDDPEAKKPCV